MVYTSLPSYLNPPNWNQQQQEQSHHHHHQQAGGNGGVVGSSGGAVESHQLPLQLPPRPEASTVVSAARPNSMADRARQAKLPQPDQALKCPRCDSTNTKFCYFNNYSLSQPRHFCKTCRRYWTRGGALRNVPVGGGCRRNKRSKSSSSKSTSTESKAGTSLAGAMSGNRGGGAINSNITPPHLPFLAPLNSLPDYGAAAAGIGLNFNFSGIPTVDPVDYQVGSSSGVGLDQWRSAQQLQQFPLFAGLESTPATATTVGMYQFDGEAMMDAAAFPSQVHGKASASASGLISHDSSVKMEENPQRLNLPKRYLDMPGNGQYSWGGDNGRGNGSGSGTASGTIAGSSGTTGGPGWTDIVSFNSSTTGNFL